MNEIKEIKEKEKAFFSRLFLDSIRVHLSSLFFKKKMPSIDPQTVKKDPDNVKSVRKHSIKIGFS